ncbi:MAG TPA: ATP-binding protein, partial [Verrucomicrobiae bacterium]
TELAAETQRRSGVRCRFRADKAARISQPLVALHLFRLALEAVNNALRHAHARNITISLNRAPTHLTLEVVDDGTGLPPNFSESRGLGLHTMRYRAQSIGGRLSIGAGPAGGTAVSCFLPAERAKEPGGKLHL